MTPWHLSDSCTCDRCGCREHSDGAHNLRLELKTTKSFTNLSWCRTKFFGGSCNAFGLLAASSRFLSAKTGLALGKGGVPDLPTGGVENFSCKSMGRLLKTGVVVDLDAIAVPGASASAAVSSTAPPGASGDELTRSATTNSSAGASVPPILRDS